MGKHGETRQKCARNRTAHSYADLRISSAFSIAAERRNSDFRIPHAAAALSMRSAPVFGHLKDRLALASPSESLGRPTRRFVRLPVQEPDSYSAHSRSISSSVIAVPFASLYSISNLSFVHSRSLSASSCSVASWRGRQAMRHLPGEHRPSQHTDPASHNQFASRVPRVYERLRSNSSPTPPRHLRHQAQGVVHGLSGVSGP